MVNMDGATLKSKLAENLDRVEERLLAACRRAGRSRAEVTLVAVTKTATVEAAATMVELGVLDLGEGRPQELWRKAAVLPAARWHLIGHLQRNKIERTLPFVQCIHSVANLDLLTALEHEAVRQARQLDVLLEVNASGEANKQGFRPEEVLELTPVLKDLKFVRVTGLMTMAAYEDNPERCRPTFALLRQLRDRLREEMHGTHPLTDLSMGMSNDFEIAVEEGATLVRIGTALFAGCEGDAL
jgi:PLP dependent protein